MSVKVNPRGQTAVSVSKLIGKVATINSQSIRVLERDNAGKISRCSGTVTNPTDGGAGFAVGCVYVQTDGGVGSTMYVNEGSTTSCDFNVVESAASNVTAVVAGAGMTGGGSEGSVTLNVIGDETSITVAADLISVKDGGITTAKLATASVTPAKIAETEARTATADGLTTGAITPLTGFKKFVTVTSAAATDAITLPAVSSTTIGQEIFLTVGANGYELLTVASSNVTINQVDCDGTNQLDVAANTTVRCTQISATAWLAETIAATAIAITAPDND